ncbi:M50 family metallopeptidase [Shewanella sp. Isolate11]|uniref:M50 family metallopeptidase n=1 Tax=Shewanella sp. Isolate11 TaxID=2908530 RepID=UPI001EFE0EB2|nr:M50 family metallopeptidase [Shewanella sp. Isolate11]MCG9696836.1 M50 family metallopeptidase [Shewanella sp. Isolate11]
MKSTVNSTSVIQPVNSIPSRSQFIIELLMALILTRIPYVNVPFNWLESYFHELSHALATMFTGGMVSHIQLFSDGAGLCFSQGGWPILIGFAGYFGAALWGALLFNLAIWQRGIRFSYAFMGAWVFITLLLWGRDILTIVILTVLGLLFLLPIKLNHNPILSIALRIIALMVMLNAMASPAVLLGITGRGDAIMLAQQTWLPTWFWVFVWVATSGVMLWLCWRRVDRAKDKFG